MKKLVIMALSLSSALFLVGCNFCGRNSNTTSNVEVVKKAEGTAASCCGCGAHEDEVVAAVVASEQIEDAAEIAEQPEETVVVITTKHADLSEEILADSMEESLIEAGLEEDELEEETV